MSSLLGSAMCEIAHGYSGSPLVRVASTFGALSMIRKLTVSSTNGLLYTGLQSSQEDALPMINAATHYNQMSSLTLSVLPNLRELHLTFYTRSQLANPIDSQPDRVFSIGAYLSGFSISFVLGLKQLEKLVLTGKIYSLSSRRCTFRPSTYAKENHRLAVFGAVTTT